MKRQREQIQDLREERDWLRDHIDRITAALPPVPSPSPLSQQRIFTEKVRQLIRKRPSK